MDWRLLAFPFTTVLLCHAQSFGDRHEIREIHSVLDNSVIVSLRYPNNGLPTPDCHFSYGRYLRPPPELDRVVDVPGLKDLGYRLHLKKKAYSLTCRLVRITEDPQCPQLTCPFEWSLLHHTCFLATSFVGSWAEGESFCQERGGVLATISSDTQQTALSRILSRDTWIGLKLLDDSHVYGWADGSVFRYTSWGPGEPKSFDTPHKKGCVEMREKYNFQWNDADCDHLKLCLCSVPATALTAIKSNRPPAAASTSRAAALISPIVTAVHNPECHNGWASYRSSCYRAFYEHLTYREAKIACKHSGAYLASVHSEEELSFIRNFIRENTFIGLTDIEEEGTFTWDDGSPINFFRWNPREPNNAHFGEDCVEMLALGESQWNDVPCDLRKHYVCKKSDNEPSWTEPTPLVDDDNDDFFFDDYIPHVDW